MAPSPSVHRHWRRATPTRSGPGARDRALARQALPPYTSPPMTDFVVRRLLLGVVTVLTVTTLTFALIHAAPGEPFVTMIEDGRFSAEHRDRLRERFGLDQPLSRQYVRYLSNVARGDLGESFSTRLP